MRFRRAIFLIFVAITLFLLKPLSLAESTKNIFTYELENGKAILTQMDDTVMEQLTELIIPETIDGHEVIGLGSWLIYSGSIQKLTLPASLKTFAFDAIANDFYLTTIQVAEGSDYFQSIDGVLFQKNADGSLALHTYPGGKAEVSYTVPDGVTAILPSAFDSNRNLNNILLTNEVTGIGTNAFSNSNINEILLPEGLVEIGDFAFSYCSNLRQLKLPASLTTIGEGAFGFTQALSAFELSDEGSHFRLWENALMSSDGKRLIALPIASGNTAFIVPEGVETIDNSAFADNASIKSIILPEGLISIGYGAFSRLSSLSEEIVLPATLKHIGPTAFLQYNAASITLPEGLQSIGAEAFRESKLTSISMPDSVNQLGENAFLDNLFLTEAKLPAGVSTLPWGLFAGCEALRKAVIPAGVTDISVSAFGGCKDLTVHVPDSLNYIQFDAFDSMWSDSEPDLGSITLAGAEDSQAKQIAAQMGLNYVVDISERYLPIKGDGSYTSADGFEYEVKDGAVTITGIYPEGKKVVIPSEIDGCPVRALGKVYQEGESQSSIIWNDGYRELVLPEGLETINSYAFGWSSIEKINLPGTLKTIGSDVFWNTNIKSLALPASLENIGEGAFSHANKLSKLTVDKDNPHFYAKDGMLIDKRSNALIACAGAKGGTAKVPDGVATIGPYAFSGCEKLTAVTLPESVTALGEYAFAWCYKLGKVALPSGIKSLPDKAFFYCSGLNSLTLPEGLTEIGKEALGLTYKLKKLVLPASLITIGEGAFRENGLAAFEVAEGNTAFTVQDGVLFDKGMTKLWGYPNQSKAKEYAVPQGVTEMDQGVFSESKNLKKVTLPEGITVIPQSAFSGDGKNRMVIHLPDTLTTIEDYAFGRTYWGDELVLPAGVRTIGRAFEQASFKALVLPEGLESIGAYSFRWNPELIKVTLPSTLKEIPDGAFSENPNLQEVVGIEYVDMISEYAFQECPRLTLSLPKPGAAVFSGTWRLSAAVMGAMTVSPADAGMPMIIITLNEDGTGTFENEGDPAQEISWTANGSDTLAILSQPGDILMMFFTVADNKLIVEYDQMSVIFER